MAFHGKRLKQARATVDRETLYGLDEAVAMVKANASAKFDETVEVAVGLGVDPRHADQMVRGVVLLPNGTGKSVRVAVFARGDKAEEARAAGTVTPNVADAVKAAKAGQVEFRVEKAGIIHGGVGKASFDEAALIQNIRAFVDALVKAKPTGAKGTYLRRVALSSTMGPGVRVDVANFSTQQDPRGGNAA